MIPLPGTGPTTGRGKWPLWLSLTCVLLVASTVLAAEGNPPDSLRATDGSGQVGVLILAHGGSDRWDRIVTETVAQAQHAYPTEIAFGMGMQVHEVEQLQQAVDRLHQRGVDRIVAVPLLVSSFSQVIRQFQYLLGLRDHGPWEAKVLPITSRVPVVMTGALDDDRAVAEVLLERARALSHAPKEEAVIIVSHGPSLHEDNAQWLTVTARLADWIKVQGGFREVIAVTMRDDALRAVREHATRHMREVVSHHSREGRALVIPLLIAGGGIETKIPERLAGLEYVYRGATLLPHPKLAQWIVRQVERASAGGQAF